MNQGVKEHQDKERMEKIREREHDQRLRRYHNDILTAPNDTPADVILPPSHDDDVVWLLLLAYQLFDFISWLLV